MNEIGNYNFLNISQIDLGKWRTFVHDHPEGTVFHLPEFYFANSNVKSYNPFFIGIENQNKKIIGILIAIIKKDLIYPLSSLTKRADVFDGPLVKNNDTGVLVALLEKYNSFANANKIIYTLVRNSVAQKTKLRQTYSHCNYKYQPHLNIVIDLSPGKEYIWKKIKRNRKDGINKGLKQGFEFKEISDVNPEVFDNLVNETYKNTAIPTPPKDLYYSFNQTMTENDKWFGLFHKNELIICLLALTYKDTLSAYVIGIKKNDELLRLRPVDVFYWEVIKWAIDNDFAAFNWLGAGKPDKEYGVRKFKLQYGGELFEPGRYINTHLPRVYHTMEFLYDRLSKLKKRLSNLQ